ncbi:hypothetical protein Ccrd_021586 [Cynara cardunculus var. scolymus]|uniref:Uncharacterized protein n=1 Tax=Cynara cardunculus var. scolymus TaxID=59895 RepID=A0A103Y059_CYNCS|nr:hypothetical protein Ccrd_021586 [Cynara cardunculus var. scolymus]
MVLVSHDFRLIMAFKEHLRSKAGLSDWCDHRGNFITVSLMIVNSDAGFWPSGCSKQSGLLVS